MAFHYYDERATMHEKILATLTTVRDGQWYTYRGPAASDCLFCLLPGDRVYTTCRPYRSGGVLVAEVLCGGGVHYVRVGDLV